MNIKKIVLITILLTSTIWAFGQAMLLGVYPSRRTNTNIVIDTVPAPYSLTDVTGATLSTQYTSNTITVSGINAAATIRITGTGTYSINGSGYTSAQGTVVNGNTITVRNTSSASNSTAVNTTLTVGGVSDTYTITTVAASSDTVPDAITFTDVTGATISTVYTSNTVTISGLTGTATIRITGGTYSKNGGSYTSAQGTITNGNTVAVRVTSSGSESTAVNATVTIGGVSDTYTVTTGAGTVPQTLQVYSYTSSYGNAQVSYGVLYPENYNPAVKYPVLYAQGGNGEKAWYSSTPANWQTYINKPGQCIYEIARLPTKYPMLVISPMWPFSPSDPVIIEGGPTQRRYGAMLNELIDKTYKTYNTDSTRIYITGLSEGGADIWEYLTQYGNRIAAAVPISCWTPTSLGGTYTTFTNAQLASCGAEVWHFQGDNDAAGGSANNVGTYLTTVKNLGMATNYTVYEEDGHVMWDQVYKNIIQPTYTTLPQYTPMLAPPVDIYLWLLTKQRPSP